MNCQGARKFLSAFVDDELDVRTNVEVLEHLEMCPSCAARVERLRDLNAAVASSIASVRMPAGLSGRSLRALTRGERFAHRWMGAHVRVLAQRGWFRIGAAAASILLVFGVIYASLVRPPAQFNSRAVLAHIAVMQDRLTHFYNTPDPERARRLALFKMGSMPDVPLLGREQFQLMGAGPQEIGLKNVGHFAFRYGSVTVSMFVLEGLDLSEVSGDVREGLFGEMRLEKRGDYGVVAWRRGGFTYILVARTSPENLIEMIESGGA